VSACNTRNSGLSVGGLRACVVAEVGAGRFVAAFAALYA
jgi:hypothetical protein